MLALSPAVAVCSGSFPLLSLSPAVAVCSGLLPLVSLPPAVAFCSGSLPLCVVGSDSRQVAIVFCVAVLVLRLSCWLHNGVCDLQVATRSQ